jgi:Domain of unknown function (DUF5666)
MFLRSKTFVLAVGIGARVLLATMFLAGGYSPTFAAMALRAHAAQPAQAPAGRSLGTIKTISGNTITLTTDAGASVTITLQDSTRLLRIEPGEKDLKNAVKITQQELQPGDRILAVGDASADGHTIVASSVMAMKHADVVSKQQNDLQDWQRRGVGGLVKSVDPAAGTVTISVTTAGVAKPVTVQTSKTTILRRYAPNSVKFDDAKVSTINDVKPGDQLRARGMKNADGSEIAADEIVTGAFRNLSGLITSIDAAGNTLTVNDLATKKPVVVKIAADSQIRKLSPQMAMILSGGRGGRGAGGGAAGGTAPSAGGAAPGGAPASAPDAQAGGAAAGGNGGRGGGRGFGGRGGGADLQTMLGRLPASSLTDLAKGDAVMIVSTEGTSTDGVTAITLVSGVDTLLEANGGQSVTLPPWSLGGGGEGGDAP